MSFLSTVLWIGLLLSLMLMIVGFLTLTRATHVSVVIAPGEGNRPPAVGDSLFLKEIQHYTGTLISGENSVEILRNGDETNPRLWADLRAARQSILIQMYYVDPGKMLDSLRDILVERAHAGVRIAVLLDAFGASGARRSKAIQDMEEAGVMLKWFRQIRWYSLNKATLRSHNRGILIDNRIGYTGGFGIADYWTGDGLSDGKWRETNVRFQGPAVASLQAAFAAGWAEATGVLLTGSAFFSQSLFEPAGEISAGFMHTVPNAGSTSAERFLALTIAGARKSLYITNSYAVPGPDFRTLLVDAAQRGVDVRLLTVGKKSDVKATSWAGRAFYEELLRGGIRIYQYEPAMMHAKTMVVDGVWTSIGSMNLDNRSLALNNETNLVVMDSSIGERMIRIFMADLDHAEEVILEDFLKRPWSTKLMEWCSEKLWRIL